MASEASTSGGVVGGMPATTASAASLTFEAAQFRRDVGTLDRFLSPDFRMVHGSGRISGRSEFLSDFSNAAEVFDPFVIKDRTVTPLGSGGAIVSGEAIVTGKIGSRPFRQHFRYADAYSLTGGRWQVVYTQITVMKD